MKDTEDFTFDVQKLMIRTRLDLEPEFQEGKTKRSVLWGRVLSKIQEINPDFKMTREQINRKFLNFHTTYKRIKNRYKSTGKCATTWEFYEMFDDVYSANYSTNPSVENLQSSFNGISDLQDIKQEVFSMNETVFSSDNFADENCFQKNKRQKTREENETLEFLKKEAERKEERHKEMVDLKKHQIEVELEKVKVMIDLKDILQKMLEK